MDKEQAQEMIDTLHYISGQLKGLAVLMRISAEAQANADPERWKQLAQDASIDPAAGAPDGYEAGYYNVARLLLD